MPSVVRNLIIINVILAVLQYVLYQSIHISLADYLGLHYFRSELFRPWQLVTHMFMHGSPGDLEGTVLHLGSNMIGLWMLGSILESRWGPRRFLTFYLICGLGAAACQLGVMSMQLEPAVQSYQAFMQNPTADQFISFCNHHLHRGGADGEILRRIVNTAGAWASDPGNTTTQHIAQVQAHQYLWGAKTVEGLHAQGLLDDTMVGASGAVFGVLFAFGYLLPNLQLMFIFPPIPIKAKWFVTLYALFELYSGLRNSPTDNVAHFAHLGGLLFAFVLLRLWGYRFNDPRF